MQVANINFLIQKNLISLFMDLRYDEFFEKNILKKLASLSEQYSIQCTEIAWKIHCMYAQYYKNTSHIINDFVKLCEEKNYKEAFSLVKNTYPSGDIRHIPDLEAALR